MCHARRQSPSSRPQHHLRPVPRASGEELTSASESEAAFSPLFFSLLFSLEKRRERESSLRASSLEADTWTAAAAQSMRRGVVKSAHQPVSRSHSPFLLPSCATRFPRLMGYKGRNLDSNGRKRNRRTNSVCFREEEQEMESTRKQCNRVGECSSRA